MDVKKELEELGINKNSSVEEIRAKTELLKELQKKSNSKLKTWLNWLAQPVLIGDASAEQMRAGSEMNSSYWNSMSKISGDTNEDHKHIHIHRESLENMTPDQLLEVMMRKK